MSVYSSYVGNRQRCSNYITRVTGLEDLLGETKKKNHLIFGARKVGAEDGFKSHKPNGSLLKLTPAPADVYVIPNLQWENSDWLRVNPGRPEVLTRNAERFKN